MQHSTVLLDAIADRICDTVNVDDYGAVALAIGALGYRPSDFTGEIPDIQSRAKEMRRAGDALPPRQN